MPGDLPPYLTPEGHALLRERLDHIEIVTADLVTYLQTSDTPRFTRFSLSDVPSYLTEEGFESLVRGVVRCAKPGARVVIRQFMTRYGLPRAVADRIIREPELERRCALEDRAFAYEFIIGTVPPEGDA